MALRATRKWLPYTKAKDDYAHVFTAERVCLLDGYGDFTATQVEIDAVSDAMDAGKEYPQIAVELKMREIDVVLIALHLRTDTEGNVRWRRDV